LIPFDLGESDIQRLRGLSKSSSSTRKQVFTAYYIACKSRGVDPIPQINAAGCGVVLDDK
jgi:hypothetical protein